MKTLRRAVEAFLRIRPDLIIPLGDMMLDASVRPFEILEYIRQNMPPGVVLFAARRHTNGEKKL